MSKINIHKESLLSIAELHSQLEYKCDTGYFIWKIPRPGVKVGKRAGSIKADGYRKIRLNKQEYLEHRLAWFYTYQKWPSLILDHIDRDKTNNCITNLREVSTRENGCNRKDTSIYGHNIYKSKTLELYYISMQFNGIDFYYPGFTSLEETVLTRDWLLFYKEEFNTLPLNVNMLKELMYD